MDPKELFDYAVVGMKWLAAGGAAYIATLAGLCAVPSLFSEKIKSQNDLDRIVREEAEKLDGTKQLSARQLSARFYDTGMAEVIKMGVGGNSMFYTINLGGFGANRSIARHELYHIHKGHFGYPWGRSRLLRTLHYLFRAEPQAIAYQFKLKL